MNKFNTLFEKRFLGCPLLATMRDEPRDRTVKIFYINEPGLVGVNDGIDTWISPVKGCFHNLKEGLLESQMVLAAAGRVSPEEQAVRQRHTMPTRPLMQRRSVHAH